jgi:hypothetical protein
MNSYKRVLQGGLPVVLILVCGLSAGAAAAEENEEPLPTLLELMEQQMLGMRIQISNAEMRIRNKIRDVNPPEPGTKPTPVKLYCNSNLKKIRAASTELQKIFAELGGCYETEGNSAGLSAVTIADQNRAGLARVVEMWARASSDTDVHGALGALTRAYLQLRDNADKLPACPALPQSPVSTSDLEQP